MKSRKATIGLIAAMFLVFAAAQADAKSKATVKCVEKTNDSTDLVGGDGSECFASSDGSGKAQANATGNKSFSDAEVSTSGKSKATAKSGGFSEATSDTGGNSTSLASGGGSAGAVTDENGIADATATGEGSANASGFGGMATATADSSGSSTAEADATGGMATATSDSSGSSTAEAAANCTAKAVSLSLIHI